LALAAGLTACNGADGFCILLSLSISENFLQNHLRFSTIVRQKLLAISFCWRWFKKFAIYLAAQ
jgi:hypothetical protein